MTLREVKYIDMYFMGIHLGGVVYYEKNKFIGR